MPMTEKLGYEKELLGFYISGHPMDAFAGLDSVIDTFAKPDDLVNFDDRTTFRLGGTSTMCRSNTLARTAARWRSSTSPPPPTATR